MRHRLLWLLFLTASALSAAEPPALDAAIQLFKDKKLPEARSALEKIVVAEPDNAEANYWLGFTLLTLNDTENAVPSLEKAVALAPTKAACIHALGDAYGLSAQRASFFNKTGFAKKCIAAYDKAVALEPDNVEYRKSRYEFYRQAPSFAGGGMDKAAAEAAEIEKRDPIQGAGLRSDLRQKAGHTDEAFAILADLRHRFPESKLVRFQLGRLAAMTGEHLDEGADALKEYLSYTPKSGEPPLWSAHWRLAQVMEAKGNAAAARTEYEETLKLNPSFDRARTALQKLPAKS